ncbi:MAG: hypothetical protein ABL879_12780 [Devosia sp.]
MDQDPVVSGTVSQPPPTSTLNIISIGWDPQGLSLSVDIGLVLAIIVALALVGVAIWRGGFSARGVPMEIDQAEIGVGDNKITLRPNLTDRQVAYAIWVELSTRKIGLPIDLQDDVISEIYDSWYNYFSVTRDLIKTVSVAKVRDQSTRKIINLSIDVLNNGLRPHLTKWQARYRHWYEKQIGRIDEKADASTVIDPQSIQKSFPKFSELELELLMVNKRLIAYRSAMQTLVFDKV